MTRQQFLKFSYDLQLCMLKINLLFSTEWMDTMDDTMVTVGDTRKKHELLFEEIKYELNVIWQSRRAALPRWLAAGEGRIC